MQREDWDRRYSSVDNLWAVKPNRFLVVEVEGLPPVGHDLTNMTDDVGGPSDPSLLYTPDRIAGELPGLEIEKAERVLRDVGGEELDAIDALIRAQARNRRAGFRARQNP